MSESSVPRSPPDVVLTEHDESDPVELSQTEERAIDDLRVGDTAVAPLSVEHERADDGAFLTRVHSDSAIGTVRLPSGRRVTVTPKETVSRLLWLLGYVHDTPAPTLSAAADLETGAQFHRVLASLFDVELQTVLRRGLDRSYTDRREVQTQVRGRVNPQRQLRRATGPKPTDFAVDYRASTTATTLNHAVAVAARRLQSLLATADGVEHVDDTGGVTTDRTETDQIAARLDHTTRAFRDRLDGQVPQSVSRRAVDRVELSRLTDHYARLLTLTRTVLAGEFFDDLRPGERRVQALFVDADTLFERVLERATRAVVADRSYTVVGQATVPALVQGPHGADTVRPDVVVARERDVPNEEFDGETRNDPEALAARAVAVLDAKWKLGGATGRDATQLAGYCLVTNTPGALVFPGGDGIADSPSTVAGRHELHSLGLPTDAEAETPAGYTDEIETTVAEFLAGVIDGW